MNGFFRLYFSHYQRIDNRAIGISSKPKSNRGIKMMLRESNPSSIGTSQFV